MGKSTRSNLPSVPVERSIRTRSAALRKKSADQQIDGQIKPFLDEKNYPPRDYSTIQSKPKYFPNHEDIDIYFASCINPTFKTKEEPQYCFEKEFISEKNYRQNKKPTILIAKQEVFDEGIQSQVKSELESIEEEEIHIEKSHFHQDSQSPESPIFGRKLMKNLRTPPNKLVDLKDFDQSEEVVRRNFIDQLEEVSKDVSSPSDNRQILSSPINQIVQKNQFSSPIVKTEKRISKRRKTPENKKKKQGAREYFQKPDEIEFSFRRNAANNDALRRAQILRLSSLQSIYSKYEKTERNLMSLDNALKSLIYYYQLRELNPKVLMFRANVHKLLKQEIDKMLALMREKKEICAEVIQEKSKTPCEMIHYYDEKMDMPGIE